MRSKTQMKVASLLTVALGIWIAVSPAFISVTGDALTNIIATGAVIGVLGLVQYFVHNSMPSWINILAAMWLIASAFTFDVSDAMTINMLISGIGAFFLSIWDGFETKETYNPLGI